MKKQCLSFALLQKRSTNCLQDDATLFLLVIHSAFLLSRSRFFASKPPKKHRERSLSVFFRISRLAAAMLSGEASRWRCWKRSGVRPEVAPGGERQQTSGPRYLGRKSTDNSGREMQDLVQRLEVLAQLERKWMEAAGEAHLQ